MTSTRTLSLMLASAAAVLAQNGTVQNAALYQGSNPAVFSSLSSVVGILSSTVVEFNLLATAPNIISPRMLAVLSYPAELVSNPFTIPRPAAVPVNATLYIRPAESSTLIPVNVTSAVTGAVTFVVPGYVPLGGAELLYQIDNGPTQWTPLSVVQSSFAFFRNGSGGSAIAQAIQASGPGFAVGLANPIQPGQTLALTGSGLGYGTTVTATIGGISAPVIYAGPGGTAPAGNDQIQVQVPQGVADGCYVPVVVTVNQATIVTTISKTSDGSACKHPWQLSLNDLKTLDGGGSLADATINLQTALSVVTTAAGSRNESAYLSTGYITAAQLAGHFQAPPVPAGCNLLTPVAGGEAIPTLAYFAGDFGPAPLPPVPDIGSSATLQSPTTKIQFISPVTGLFTAQGVPPPSDGPLSNLPVPAVAGGKWTFQSNGGADLPASAFGFTLPAPVQLTGTVPVTLNHTQDMTVSWNGAAFDSGATAIVSLQGGGFVSCTAPAGSGTVTIPAALLSGFGANTIGTLGIGISEAGAGLPHTQFQTKSGATLVMFVEFSSSDSRPVFFQ